MTPEEEILNLKAQVAHLSDTVKKLMGHLSAQQGTGPKSQDIINAIMAQLKGHLEVQRATIYANVDAAINRELEGILARISALEARPPQVVTTQTPAPSPDQSPDPRLAALEASVNELREAVAKRQPAPEQAPATQDLMDSLSKLVNDRMQAFRAELGEAVNTVANENLYNASRLQSRLEATEARIGESLTVLDKKFKTVTGEERYQITRALVWKIMQDLKQNPDNG